MSPIIIAGGDEAGRGAVIGPLVVSMICISKAREKKLAEIGVRDSKLLSPKKREFLLMFANQVCPLEHDCFFIAWIHLAPHTRIEGSLCSCHRTVYIFGISGCNLCNDALISR